MNEEAVRLAEPREDDEGMARLNLPVESKLAVQLARAEVDQQISTAHAYPRNIVRVTRNIMSLATLDEEAAKECIYALPRGGKPITGASIRLAEIIASQWGNCRSGARVVDVNRHEKYLEAEGVFHDLETNTATTKRVKRRIVDSRGRLFNDDMIIMTGNAASSIALRNAILGGVPRAVWRKAEESARAVLAGDIKTLTERRAEAMKAFAAFGVKPEQIFHALDVQGLEEITLEHMPTLLGMHASLKSGEATVEEMFPAEKASVPEPQKPKPAAAAAPAKDVATAAPPQQEPARQADDVPGEPPAKPAGTVPPSQQQAPAKAKPAADTDDLLGDME